MATVLPFRGKKDARNEFVFLTRRIRLRTEDGDVLFFPCIGLYHRESMIPICFPGFERWLFALEKAEQCKSETLKKKSEHLRAFLNWFLWNTEKDRVCEATVQDLRGFALDFRTTESGLQRDPQEWARGVSDVYAFLVRYYRSNEGLFEFGYSPDQLVRPFEVKSDPHGRRIIVTENNHLSVKPPKKEKRKYRLLLRGHLEMFLYEAKKWDPMIALGIMLQSYGGLREGEVVNVSRGGIRKVYEGFGRIGRIKVDLTDEAPFAKERRGKTEFGSIKKYRNQEIFPDFVSETVKALDAHDAMLAKKGADDGPDSPLFLNEWGKPMSVACYSARVKALFRDHFLPDLKRFVEAQGTWAENAPYIEAYEKEYPGAHMFRHWFTMYLLQNSNLTDDEISKWRGDSCIDSMQAYIHANSEFIRLFRESVFAFQKSVLEEIL